jgi:hypothetical protein
MTARADFAKLAIMATLSDIERAVATLSEPELDAFRRWFEMFDAARFDEKIENDANTGRLDEFAAAALRELADGRARSL